MHCYQLQLFSKKKYNNQKQTWIKEIKSPGSNLHQLISQSITLLLNEARVILNGVTRFWKHLAIYTFNLYIANNVTQPYKYREHDIYRALGIPHAEKTDKTKNSIFLLTRYFFFTEWTYEWLI